LINSKVSLSGQTDVSEVQLWYWVGESPLSESKLLMAAQFWFHHIPVWFPHGSRKGIQQKVLKHCKKIPLHRLACPECWNGGIHNVKKHVVDRAFSLRCD